MSKRASLKSRSPLDDFLSDERQAAKETRQQVNQSTSQQDDIERTGFYVRADQNKAIDELRIKLKDHKIKTNRSEILRVALDQFLKKDIEEVVDLLTSQ